MHSALVLELITAAAIHFLYSTHLPHITDNLVEYANFLSMKRRKNHKIGIFSKLPLEKELITSTEGTDSEGPMSPSKAKVLRIQGPIAVSYFVLLVFTAYV